MLIGTPVVAMATTVTVASGGILPKEAGPTSGVITVTRDDTAGNLDVHYTVGGAATPGDDYQTLPNVVTIPDGSNTAEITIRPVSDNVPEAFEDVVITLQPGAGYTVGVSNVAFLWIQDDDLPTVTINADTSVAFEQGQIPGLILFHRENGNLGMPLTVSYTVSGTATPSGDYTALSGTVTFDPNVMSVTVPITPVDDGATEPREAVTVQLTPVNGVYSVLNNAPTSATVYIVDAGGTGTTITIEAVDNSADEHGNRGLYKFTRTGGSMVNPLRIYYGVDGTSTATSGDDYTPLKGWVDIPADSDSVTVELVALADVINFEDPETVIIKLLPDTTQGAYDFDPASIPTATVTIDWLNTPRITFEVAQVNLGEADVTYMLKVSSVGDTSLVGSLSDASQALTISYAVSGTATAGADFTALPGTVIIPAGQRIAYVPIPVKDDDTDEPAEDIVITLSSPGAGDVYVLGAVTEATVNIEDNDLPLVRVAATDAFAVETGDDTGTFTFTREGDISVPLTVNYSVASPGTGPGQLDTAALEGTDYVAIGATVRFEADQRTTILVVKPIDNATSLGDKVVVLRLAANDGVYRLDNPSEATVTIVDDETNTRPWVEISVGKTAVSESDQDMTEIYIRRRGANNTQPLKINYTVTGTATPGQDYVVLNAEVNIKANQDRATITFTPVADSLVEGDESVIVTLDQSSDYLLRQGMSSVKVVINDDEATLPTANFGLEQVVEEGNKAFLNVTLDSESPYYPVEIPFFVRGAASNPSDHDAADGTITISSGRFGSVEFHTFTDKIAEGDESLIFTMGTPVNARPGLRTTTTVFITDRNIAPRIHLTAMQGGQPVRIALASGGVVRVKAEVFDPNTNDVHTFDWSASNNNLQRITQAAEENNVFIFDPAGMSPGFYKVRVKVTDNNPGGPKSTQVELQLRVMVNVAELMKDQDYDHDGVEDSTEGRIDSDGDGIPEFADSNKLNAHELQGLSGRVSEYIIRTEAGLRIGAGDVAHVMDLAQSQVLKDDIINYGAGEGVPGVRASDTSENIGGYFDFEITDVPVVGRSVQVVVPQLQPIPAKAVYRLYTPLVGWGTFMENRVNTLASAPSNTSGVCPLPGDPVYIAGLHEGDKCVQLTIEDGGPNDADGMANYVVKNLGGVAVPSELPVGDSNPELCGGLLCSAHSGVGAVNGGMLALLALVGWRRRRGARV